MTMTAGPFLALAAAWDSLSPAWSSSAPSLVRHHSPG
jgi:hypothetical protein